MALSVEEVIASLPGLASTPIRTAAGTSSRKRPSRFAITSAGKKLMPVALPSGRARLATRPSLTGSSPGAEDDRDRRSRRFGRERGGVCRRGNHAHLTADQISRQLRKPIETAFRPAVLDGHVLALDMARFGEPPVEGIHELRNQSGRLRVEHPNNRHRRLLRARRERPRGRRAAEKSNEVAPVAT